MMSEEREVERGDGAEPTAGPGAVRASIQRWSGSAWQVVQDGALFDGVLVMTDLTAELRAVLDGLASTADAAEGRLSVLIGPAVLTRRAPEEFERVGVRAVTALRTPPGEFGEAEGVARLELERPSRHQGVLCSHLDVPALMPDLRAVDADGGAAADAPTPRMAGVPYLARLATVVAERDGTDAGMVPRSAGSGPDRWTMAADALAAEAARTRFTDLDLGNPMVPRFGLGNFVCMVFACC